MFYFKITKKIAAIVGIAALTTTATMAVASLGTGVAVENFVTAEFNENALVNHDRIKFQTKDPTDVRVQKLTFAPHSKSGWHHHPGLLIVTVKSGLVTLTDHNCGTKTYGHGSPNGAVFIEGHDTAVEASSIKGAVAYATIIVPRGQPPRLEDDVPFCAM